MKRPIKYYVFKLELLCCVIFEAWFSVNQAFKHLTPQSKQMVSFADWLINGYGNFQSDGVGFLLILLSILLLTGSDFRYANLLQYRSRRHLWDRQLYHICVDSVVFGTCYVVSSCFWVSKKAEFLYNWQDIESYFFMVNKTTGNYGIGQVVCAFIIGVIIEWLLWGIVFVLLHWIMRREALIWIVIISLRFGSGVILHIHLGVSLSYRSWADKAIVWEIIGSLLLFFLIYLCGRKVVPHKDFYEKDVE